MFNKNIKCISAIMAALIFFQTGVCAAETPETDLITSINRFEDEINHLKDFFASTYAKLDNLNEAFEALNESEESQTRNMLDNLAKLDNEAKETVSSSNHNKKVSKKGKIFTAIITKVRACWGFLTGMIIGGIVSHIIHKKMCNKK